MRELNRRGRRSGDAVDSGFRERVRRDLESRGLAAAASGPVALRIAPQAAELTGDAYAAFLDGVAAAGGGSGDGPLEESGAVEMQRLVQDFAVELKKLDEGLRLLSTYLLRIRDRAVSERSRVVH
jgi:hypothetical protein